MAGTSARNFVWTATGAGIYALCQWGIIAALARFGSLADVGVLSLGLAVTAPIFLFFGLNLRVAQATDASGEFSRGDYLYVRGVATAMAMVLCCLVTFGWPATRNHWVVVAGVAVAKAVETFFDLAIGRMQLQGRFRSIALLQATRGLAAVAVFVLVFRATGNLSYSVIAWAGAWLFLLAPVLLEWWGGELNPPTDRRAPATSASLAAVRKLWVTALPLGGAAVLDSVVLNAPRYVLQIYTDAESVGVFSGLAYLMTIGGVAVGAIGYVITPRLARIGLNNRSDFLRELGVSCVGAAAIGIGGVVVAWTFGADLLNLVYSEAFSVYSQELTLIMWTALVWYLAGLTGCALNALRRFGMHLLVQAVSAITVIALAVLFVPEWGINGAIYATLAAMCIRLAAAVSSLGICLTRWGRP